MNPVVLPIYQARIVPRLHAIQHEHGYLKREELERFSKEANLPLYRLQAVASFFPHFQLTMPAAVTVRICRDTACHMAGAGEMLKALASLHDGQTINVQGVSCLGRCDRAPAACISCSHSPTPDPADRAVNGHGLGTHAAASKDEEDVYYLGKSVEQMKQIIATWVARPEGSQTPARPASGESDDGRYHAKDWMIDPYKGAPAEYNAVRKAVALRMAGLEKASEYLKTNLAWSRERAEQFRLAAQRRGIVDYPLDKAALDAVLAWQTEDAWAAGPEMGGWADPLLKELDDTQADLRGMGGAGIPATQKWRDVRDAVRTARRRRADDRAFIVVNGDESEPATFKDREILLHAPHVVIEGVILAGLITEATQGFIYIRHEYPEQIAACRREIARAEAMGICGPQATVLGRPFPVSVFVSPGGYICGEQSALIEAMSDRRGEPRNIPPKLETNGLDDRPTLVSNVETYGWAPYIIVNSGKTYAELGVNNCRGRRFFSVCGDVKRPGVYEVPMGMTLRELIYGQNHCQGIVGDRPLKAFAPSGPSGGFLPARLTAKAGLPRNYTTNKTWIEIAKRRGFAADATELDILDLELELNVFRALSPTQALGAGLVVYAEGRDMAEQAVNAMEFFRNESCGKCVPCRIGSQKMAGLGGHLLAGTISAAQWNEELLPTIKELSDVLSLASICGLGRSVPMPLKTVIEYFPRDLGKYLAGSV